MSEESKWHRGGKDVLELLQKILAPLLHLHETEVVDWRALGRLLQCIQESQRWRMQDGLLGCELFVSLTYAGDQLFLK